MRTDGKTSSLFSLSALTSAGVLLLILIFLLRESAPMLMPEALVQAVTTSEWYPQQGQFGMLPMIVGTLAAGLGALLLAAPLGLTVAVYGHMYASKRFALGYRTIMELMAGIPSVVYGFWGLIVLVPWIGNRFPPGASLVAGILVLALMILPLLALSADAAFKQVPKRFTEAASAMGLSRWGTFRRILLPNAAPAIASGAVLQLGRALGETMAVLMVCGNVVQLPDSLFAPVRTLTANIALEMAYATDTHRTALFLSGLLLLVMTLVLMAAANLVRQKHA